MNPLLHATIGAAVNQLTRRCPKCGRKQTVSRREELENVKCVSCNALVPPPKRSRGGR